MAKSEREEKLNLYWQEMMMAMIGEQFDDLGEHVCGAVANIRQKGDKVGNKLSNRSQMLFRLLFGLRMQMTTK